MLWTWNLTSLKRDANQKSFLQDVNTVASILELSTLPQESEMTVAPIIAAYQVSFCSVFFSLSHIKRPTDLEFLLFDEDSINKFHVKKTVLLNWINQLVSHDILISIDQRSRYSEQLRSIRIKRYSFFLLLFLRFKFHLLYTLDQLTWVFAPEVYLLKPKWTLFILKRTWNLYKPDRIYNNANWHFFWKL